MTSQQRTGADETTGFIGFRAQSGAAGQTVRDRRRGARERRRPATDGTAADVTSVQGGRLCQVGYPGCGGSKSRRGCGLRDGRLAGRAPPTEVGSAHSADGRDGEAGDTTAACGEDAGGVWRCCERVTEGCEIGNLEADRVASQQRARHSSRRSRAPHRAGRARFQSFGDGRRRRWRERAKRRRASATATGGRSATGEAVARAQRRRDEEATTGSDAGPRSPLLRQSPAGAFAVSDVGVSLRAA